MGLLITTSLIMVNTYGNVDKASPPQRGFGLIDMWMCGTQLPVSLSMLQYGYILYKMKNSHSHGKTLPDLKKLRLSVLQNKLLKCSIHFLVKHSPLLSRLYFPHDCYF
jgi:hypothetical protein